MGSALLTQLLLLILDKTTRTENSRDDVQIVNVSSDTYQAAPKGGFLLSQVKTP